MKTEAMEHLEDIRKQIEGMSIYEKIINQAVLVCAETILTVLNNHDRDTLVIFKDMIDGLFKQAEEILKQAPKNIQ